MPTTSADLDTFTVTGGGTGSFYFTTTSGYPEYPGGGQLPSGMFNGQQVVGFSTFGNPINAVEDTSTYPPNASPNPYVGISGIIAYAGHVNDPVYPNGLSLALADGSSVHIYVHDDGSGNLSLFYTTSTGGGGPLTLQLVQTPAGAIGCFVGGTLVRAPSGEVAVESLDEGDLVLTHAGEALPVRWVGHTVVHPIRSPEPWNLHPIRIRASAVADGVPSRDLLVSPGHALLIGDVLINAGELVNGGTVVQEEAETVHYWHVELDSHDLLIADGMPCESYLDDGNRASFLNGAGHVRLHGRIDRASEETCRPLVKGGPALIEARRALLARAAELGWGLEARPELRLATGERIIEPAAVAGNRIWFVLPDGIADPLRLRSGSAVPSRIDPALADTRRLGVAIGELRVDGESVSLDAACFGMGFLPPESNGHAHWRWTDGDAELALGTRAKVVELRLQIVMLALSQRDDAGPLSRWSTR